jgi:hypothetical protein
VTKSGTEHHQIDQRLHPLHDKGLLLKPGTQRRHFNQSM